MFSSVIHDYIHTIIDTKYSKRTKSTAIKYCDEVINEFLIVFSTQNPEVMKYLNDQTYAEYKPTNPIFKVSLYIDLFKPTVQNWVKSILLEKNVNERLLKTPIVTKITRLIYDNLFGKHPASKFSVIDSSKTTPTIEAVEYDESEENLVNACHNETFRLLEYKSKIETNEITKFACLLHIEEHEEEFELMKNYTRHIIELIADDIIAWSNKHTTSSSKTRTKQKIKTLPILQEEQEEINPVNEEIRSIVEKIPTTTNNISLPQPPLPSIKHNRKQKQQQTIISPPQQITPPTRRKVTTTPNVQTMKQQQPNNCIMPQLPMIDIPKIPDDDNIYPGMIDEDAYADFGGSDDEEDVYSEN